LLHLQVASFGPDKRQPWKLYTKVSENLYICHRNGVCAPLYCSHLHLVKTKLQRDSALCNLRYATHEQIPHTADRLRYFRCQKDIHQSEVADYVGIERSTYIGYENTNRDSYPLDKLTRIAEFLQVTVTDLLDNYNRFLYEGQGQQMKTLRKNLRMTQADFSKQLQTPLGTVKRWEQNQARMTKRTWERMQEVVLSARPLM